METKAHIKKKARELGFDLCGVTSADPPPHTEEFRHWLDEGHHGDMSYMARRVERRSNLQEVLPGAKSVVVVGMNYSSDGGRETVRSRALQRGLEILRSESRVRAEALDDERDGSPSRGVIARYARGQDYHDIIGQKLEQLSAIVRSLGPDVRTKSYVDTGPILERDLAQRAGIGWIGKHTNLISRRLGNWLFLGEILTTLALEPDPPEREYCGTCACCIAACPTQAIRAPYTLDARLCISYLTIELKGSIPVELRPLIGNRIFGCDDCLEVCPWNRFARTANALKLDREDMQQPDLIELMSLTEEQFSSRFAGTPIARIQRRGLLRNVAVALGNIGDKRAIPVLQHATNDPEPLIREHAAWAIEQIA